MSFCDLNQVSNAGVKERTWRMWRWDLALQGQGRDRRRRPKAKERARGRMTCVELNGLARRDRRQWTRVKPTQVLGGVKV